MSRQIQDTLEQEQWELHKQQLEELRQIRQELEHGHITTKPTPNNREHRLQSTKH